MKRGGGISDITVRTKWLFWIMILTVFVFSAVPSVVLVDKLRAYYRFLTGGDTRAIKPSTVKRIPHVRDAKREEVPEIHFVEFDLKTDAADSVQLAASFNGWKAASMPLARGENGKWTIVVPLPEGEHYYAFEVDGVWTLDPQAAKKGRRGGRDVSMRKVP